MGARHGLESLPTISGMRNEASRNRLIEDVKSRLGIIDDLAVHPPLRFQSTKSFSKAAWACGIIGRNPVETRQGQMFCLGASVE